MHFDPLNYFDRYRDGVQALVRDRIAGQQRTEPDGGNALLQALEQSLQPTRRKGTTANSASRISAPEGKTRKRAAS